MMLFHFLILLFSLSQHQKVQQFEFWRRNVKASNMHCRNQAIHLGGLVRPSKEWGRFEAAPPSWIIDIGCNTRLDFPRLPGPVFDPPRRETARRVTNWPCLWRNWRSFGGGMSAGTFSRTAAVNRAKCMSTFFIGRVFFNPYPTKWVPMRPKEIIIVYHSSHGWTTCLKIVFKVFVLRYNPAK